MVRPPPLNAGALPVPARPPNISLKINTIISAPSPLGHLRHIPPNTPMATVLALLRTALAAALLPSMMVSIHIVVRTTVNPRNLPLTNPLLVIGASRQFSLRTRAPTPLVRPRQSTRPAVHLDNALLAYKVPLTAPPAHHTTILPTVPPLAACAVETAHHLSSSSSNSSSPIPPRAPTGATVAVTPLRSRPLIQLRRALIIAIPRHLPRLLPSPVLQPPPLIPSRPVIPFFTHQTHVRRVLRRCRKACQQLRSACHVMTASFWSPFRMLPPSAAPGSKADCVVFFPLALRKPSTKSLYPLTRPRLLQGLPPRSQDSKATPPTLATLLRRLRSKQRKSAPLYSIPGSTHRRTIYPFPPPCPPLPSSFANWALSGSLLDATRLLASHPSSRTRRKGKAATRAAERRAKRRKARKARLSRLACRTLPQSSIGRVASGAQSSTGFPLRLSLQDSIPSKATQRQLPGRKPRKKRRRQLLPRLLLLLMLPPPPPPPLPPPLPPPPRFPLLPTPQSPYLRLGRRTQLPTAVLPVRRA